MSETIVARVTEDDLDDLARVHARLPSWTKTQIVREALRLGLKAIEADPSAALIRPAVKP